MLIGELAERCGVSARMLRHYDRIGLVSPTERTTGGYREYSAEDVRRLFHVEGLRSLGLSLQEISDVLADLSFDPAAMVEDLISRTRERLRQDEELLGRLAQVQASDASAWSDVLRTIGLLRGLHAEDPSVRLRFALAHAGELTADSATLAEAALAETDPQVAGALYWALARTGDRALPFLAEALASPDAGRRQHAATALVKIGSPEATALLAEAVNDPDRLVAARAALARGRLGRPEAVPGLIALIVAGPDDIEAADLLGHLARERALGDEIAAAIAQEVPQVGAEARQRLASALKELPGRLTDSILLGLTTDADRGVSVTASFVLGERRSADSETG